MKKIIGITGKSGSGKSTFSKKLSEMIPNSKVIEIDPIASEAYCLPSVLESLSKKFGGMLFNSSGYVDKKKLVNISFEDRTKLDELADVTFAYIAEQLNSVIAESQEVIILNWILFPQVSIWNNCDLKILIESDLAKRKEKVLLRDQISSDDFCIRESVNMDYSHGEFDFVFTNDYTSDSLNSMLDAVLSAM